MNPDDDTARAGTHPQHPSGSEDALKRVDSASPDTLLGPKVSESNQQAQGDAPASGIDGACESLISPSKELATLHDLL